MNKKKIEIAIKFLIYASFFVPLIVVPSSFIFPFIVPKILTFRLIAEIMLGAYALLLAINWQQYRPRLTAINLAVGAFLLSFIISTFVGVDPYHSFWDNHERMLGLFTILHFGIYYLVCTAVLRSWNDWKWALRMFLLGGSVVMLVGMFQAWVDPQFLLNQGSDRVASTLGNSIYVGGYSLFLIFVAYLLFIREHNSVWRWIYGVLGLLAILGLFFSGTRGSMLGFVAGVGAAVAGYIVVLKDYKKIRYSMIGAAVLGIVIISLLYAFRQTEFVSRIPAVGRAVNTSLEGIKSSPRWIAWQIAVESWKDRPIFGWGPNNYFYAFNYHYNPRSLDFGYGETWFDNAHNIILNTLTVQGLIGLVIYLSIFGVGIAGLVIAWRKQGLNFHIAVVGSAFLVAHLVGNITVFENPTSYLYFMFWLAMANSLSALHASSSEDRAPIVKEESKVVDKKISSGLLVGVGVTVVLLVFIFNIQPARANMKTLDAIRYLSSDPILGVSYAKTALEFNSPHIDDIRADVGRTGAQLLSANYQKLGKDRSMEILDIIYPELERNLILHPLDIRNQISLAQLAQIGYLVSGNSQYIIDAERFLEDALEKSPRRQQVMYSLSGIKLQMNKSPEAIKLLEQAIVDNPRVGESYWRLAYDYRYLGKSEKAGEVFDLANSNGVVFSDEEQKIVMQILQPGTTVAQE